MRELSGTDAEVRLHCAGTSAACERYEDHRGAVTLGWNGRGDVLCIVHGHAATEFVETLRRRVAHELDRHDTLSLYLDLTRARSMDVGFRDALERLLRANADRLSEARVAVHRQALRLAMTTVCLRLADRLELDDSLGGLEAFVSRFT